MSPQAAETQLFTKAAQMLNEWIPAVGVGVAAGTLAWGILTWTSERKKQRIEARRRMAALYVTPFLFACDDLQSRLYNILCKGGLPVLRTQYPDGRHAYELLYLAARYFAYEPFVARYSPYATDREIIRQLERVREGFSTDRLGTDEWRIFRPQQRALGQFVLSMRQGEFGVEPDVISLWEFEEQIKQRQPSDPRIGEAIKFVQSAESVRTLGDTALRFAKVQRELVSLLEALERREAKEGGGPASLFEGERLRAPEDPRPSD
jgi:hypothetical protein